MNYIPTDM